MSVCGHIHWYPVSSPDFKIKWFICLKFSVLIPHFTARFICCQVFLRSSHIRDVSAIYKSTLLSICLMDGDSVSDHIEKKHDFRRLSVIRLLFLSNVVRFKLVWVFHSVFLAQTQLSPWPCRLLFFPAHCFFFFPKFLSFADTFLSHANFSLRHPGRAVELHPVISLSTSL